MAPEAANQKRKRGQPSKPNPQIGSASQDRSVAQSGAASVTSADSNPVGDEDAPRRKRGRPRKLYPPGTEPQSPTEPQEKRKRGRPRKVYPPGAEPQPPTEPQEKRKRGRPRKVVPEPESEAEPQPSTEAPEERKRGRQPRGVPRPEPDRGTAPEPGPGPAPQPELELELETETVAVESSEALELKKRRSRAALSRVPDRDEGARPRDDALDDRTAQAPRRNPRRSADVQNQPLITEAGRLAAKQGDSQGTGDDPSLSAVATMKTSKRGGVPPQNVDEPQLNESESTAKMPPRTRGRVQKDLHSGKKAEAAADEADKEKDGDPDNTRKDRSRPAEAEDWEEEEALAGDDDNTYIGKRRRTSDVASFLPRNRRRSSQLDQKAPKPPGSVHEGEVPPYGQLDSRTTRIPRDTIAKKWSPLDPTSILTVASLFHSASLPVLLRLNHDSQKHAHATAVLSAVSSRMRSKLTRGLPFPPAITLPKREEELEFERVVDAVRSASSQLNPLLHSLELLKTEKGRAEKQLDNDYHVLRTLRKNAKSAAAERRDRLRKMHSLVPETGKDEGSYGVGELLQVDGAAGQAFADLDDDDELKGLAGQLVHHQKSMRNNLQQIDGLIPAIKDSRAALRLALLPHVDEEALQQVVLG